MAYKKSLEVKFKKLNKHAVLPEYAHPGEDAGMDLTATSVEYDEEHDAYIYGTGLSCATEYLSAMYIMPRSSVYKHNYYLANSVGLVDPKGYRGEIKVIFKHRDSLYTRINLAAVNAYNDLPWYKKLKPGVFQEIKKQIKADYLMRPLEVAPYKVGDRIAQIIVSEIIPVKPVIVKSLNSTSRGKGGFGDSDKNYKKSQIINE